MTEKDFDKLVKFSKNLDAVPAEYFEAKPQRTVPLSDFAGAIVPKDTPDKVVGLLEDQGIKVEKYKDIEERTQLRDKFKNQMFDLGGAGLSGLLGYKLLEDDEEFLLGNNRI